MSLSVIICDDSRFARQQLANSLPAGFATELHFACDGQEALSLLRQGYGELLFLDLNMPTLDGYQVLESIRNEDLNILVIVLSADIQPLAKQRVRELGALAFMQKPLQLHELYTHLRSFGLYSEQEASPAGISVSASPIHSQEALQELVNVAMGQAARQLADLLNVFIHLPIPRVHSRPCSAISAELKQWLSAEDMVVSQGFVTGKIAGECLIHMTPLDMLHLSANLGYAETGEETKSLMIELASMLSGALLRSVAEQLGLGFSPSHPTQLSLLDNSILSRNSHRGSILSVELAYIIPHSGMPDQPIRVAIQLIVTADSNMALERRLNLLVEC